MDDRAGKTVKWTKVLGWCLSLVALWYLAGWLRSVDPTVWKYLLTAEWTALLLSLVIFQGWFVLRYFGWEKISRKFGLQDARRSNIRMWTLSELLRYVPGNIWSFAARFKGARTGGTTTSGAVAALVLEALFLTTGAGLVAALLWRITWWPIWLLATIMLVFGIPTVIQRIGLWRQWQDLPGLRLAESALLIALYSGSWLIYGVAQTIMIKSITEIDVPVFGTLIGINVLAWLIGYISIITPMGLGVREVAFVGLLRTTTSSIASVLAIATRVWLIIAEIVFLLVVLLIPRRR